MKGEEAPKLIPNKRSEPSPPYMGVGICTGSKHHSVLSQSLNKRFRMTRNGDSADIDDWSSVLIKDLRTRRVFSPAPRAVDKQGMKGSDKEKNIGILCDSQNFPSTTDSLAVKEDAEYSCKEQITEEGINISNGEILNVKCMKGTPPDAEMFSYRFAENGGSYSKETGQASQDPSIGSVLKRGSEKKDIGNNAATKFVHRPWSLLKVFKTPGSISYRRLLPYLMDMVKDDSCAPKKSNCPNIEGGPGISMHHSQRDNSLEGNDGGSDNKPHRVQFPVNGSSGASDLNVTPPEQLSLERDCCVSFNSHRSVNDDCCSKPLVNEENGKLETGASLTVHASCFDGYSTDTKPLNGEEIKRTDVGVSSDDQDVMDAWRSKEKHQSNESNEDGRHFDHTTAYDPAVGVEETDTTSEAVGLNHIGPDLFDTERISRTCGAKKEVDLKGHVLEKSGEESIQLTPVSPLDTGIFDKPEAYTNVDSGVKCVSKRVDRVIGRPLDETALRSNRLLGDNMTGSKISKRKLGLSPSSQLKLFKTPSSFNYRRLLPYLMDITKDSSGASGNVHYPKLEKRSGEDSVSLLSPLSTSDRNENLIEKSDGECCLVKYDSDPSHTGKISLTATNDEYNDAQPDSTSAEHKSETTVSLGSPEREIKGDVIPEKDKQLEAVLDIVPSIHGSCSAVKPSCFVSECSPNSGAPELPVVSEGGCMESGLKLTSAAKPEEAESSQLEAPDPLGNPPHGPKRSILKRNPRGCRGSCECLNCASFRLHAERGFEFSKNQMQDAEEVAYDLINELSRLRRLLEKSTSGSDDHPAVCTDQVKEACRKASEAEELAKTRLQGMNYDLNIHCRITCGERPRVSFANVVDERVIP
ncbi:hypothetical protein OIU85_020099 [Salix viminalis]|uniref:Uncharacterized protein n=1 Tax=Salix viminalis TaxID=40686 RepID=A0A9Q0UFN7_SALVM|nr:hypothetical protein OIU85_020099 [Salix viminalis]